VETLCSETHTKTETFYYQNTVSRPKIRTGQNPVKPPKSPQTSKKTDTRGSNRSSP